MRLMPTLLLLAVLSHLTVSPSLVHADEFDVWAEDGLWKHGDRMSGTAAPGKDGPGRLHLKVKNGDILYFQMRGAQTDEILFENGADESGKVWTAIKPPSGVPIPDLNPLPRDDPRRKFYLAPDKVLTAKRPSEFSGVIIVIEIKNLTAKRPILFASGNRSHETNRLFGAIVLDED